MAWTPRKSTRDDSNLCTFDSLAPITGTYSADVSWVAGSYNAYTFIARASDPRGPGPAFFQDAALSLSSSPITSTSVQFTEFTTRDYPPPGVTPGTWPFNSVIVDMIFDGGSTKRRVDTGGWPCIVRLITGGFANIWSFIIENIAGVTPPLGVRLATNAVLPGTPAYGNGSSGVGATLTATSNGILIVDGEAPALADRILIKDQIDQTQNGIYTVEATGSATSVYVLIRALNYNTPANIQYMRGVAPDANGAIYCQAGTANADRAWMLSAPPSVIGTDDIAFVEFFKLTIPITSDLSMGGLSAVIAEYSGLQSVVPSTFEVGTFTPAIFGGSFYAKGFQWRSWMPDGAHIILSTGSGPVFTGSADGAVQGPPTFYPNSSGDPCCIGWSDQTGSPPWGPFNEVLDYSGLGDWSCFDTYVAADAESSTGTVFAPSLVVVGRMVLLRLVGGSMPASSCPTVAGGGVPIESAACPVAWLAINEPGAGEFYPTMTARVNIHNFDGVWTWDGLSIGVGDQTVAISQTYTGSQDMLGCIVALRGGSPAFVQGTGSASAASVDAGTFTQAYGSDNTSGNCLVVDVFGLLDVPDTFAISDSQGNTYTQVFFEHTGAFGGGDCWSTFVALNCAAGANTVTITVNGSGSGKAQDWAIAVHEYSGVQTAGAIDSFGVDDVLAQTNVSAVTLDVTTTGVAELIHVAVFTHQYNAGTMTIAPPRFTPNTWTDQSHRLHVSESITFSCLVRQRGTAQIPLILAAGDDYMPTIGSQVCLWDITEDAAYEVFSGTIDDLEVKWLGITGERVVTLTCVSLEQVFDTIRLPNLLFTDQTAGTIFAAVYAYAAGCPVALGTVNDGVAIATYNTPDFPSISDVFTWLATESQYVWGVDPGTGTVYFTPPNLTPSPFTVAADDVLWEQFTLKEERHDYRNRQILKVNSNAAITSSELFSGSGQKSFTMLRPVAQITNAWLTQNRQNFATGTFTGQPSPGDVISFQSPTSGSTGYDWTPSFGYTVGEIIIDQNGYTQKVTTAAGLTGLTEPVWIEIYGQITQDNLIQWQNQGQQGFSNGDLADYTFVTALDNTQFGQVLIGSTLAATIQNLCDAINAIQTLAGITFSLATWENPVVNADTPGGSTTLIVRNKPAEASYITALSKTCANFSWSSALTTGGLTTFGTTVITFGVAGQTTGGSVFTVVYTAGSNIVESATPLQSGNWLQIQYLAVNAGYIAVENTADVIARAVIEGGTGKYQVTSSDDSALSLPAGLQLAQAQLSAFGVIPQTFEFTTMRAGLYVGQVLAISMLSPANAPTLINGSWFIQEIKAEVVPVYGDDGASDRWLPGGGHFRYTVTCIDVAQIGSWLDFWLGLSSGGGGSAGGSAVFPGGGALGPASTGNTFGGVNEQTADYAALSTDNGRIISMHSTSSPAVSLTLTLPAVPPSTTWCIFVQDTGVTNVDIDPGTLKLDGVVAALALTPGAGVYISTDGINYFTERGVVTGKSFSSAIVAVAGTPLAITHNLGVALVLFAVEDDSSPPNGMIASGVQYTSTTVLTLTFGINFSGTILVMGAA